jgi:hypothetical protein
MSDQPWNPTNPEWWRANVEARSGDTLYKWLANEYVAPLERAKAHVIAKREQRARLLAARLPAIITRHFVGWRLRTYEHDEWDQIAAEVVDAVIEADRVAS